MTHPVCAEPVRAGFFFQQPEIFRFFRFYAEICLQMR